MIQEIIGFSIRNKFVVTILLLGLIGGGIWSSLNLPIDAVPDITNNQVQVVTTSPSLATQEVEQFISYPLEAVLANLPDVSEIRSISRFGLSVVTVVFEDKVPLLDARQLVKEQISLAADEIPEGWGLPELMPITTGLGEIYQYVLQIQPGFEDRYDIMELRTIQDWIVKRQLIGIEGIIEVSSFGGEVKQYEVAVDPHLLRQYQLSINDVHEALLMNNENSGGSYIEQAQNAFYIRTQGVIQTLDEIGEIVIAQRGGVPVLIDDIGEMRFGSPMRFGAMTMDGKGEAVGGITLMLKGANSSEALNNVHERIETIKKNLPEGIDLYPYLDRSVLVGKTIETVKSNLIEGGLIVIFVLILLLGNFRAGLIVASIIPLAMLFAIIVMRYLGVSANLMSLGAIDFGIVVDGAVIIVEGVLHILMTHHIGKKLTQNQMDQIIVKESSALFRSAVFGVIIIFVVFIPIMTLTGIEGKMFRPMGITFSLMVLGALILSLTYVPVICSVLLSKNLKRRATFSDKVMIRLRALYQPILFLVFRGKALVPILAGLLFIGALGLFSRLGAEFIPTLEEGDLAMQMTIAPGSSLSESIHLASEAEKTLLANFPEVKHVVSKIGTAEIPTDPMAIEDADIMIILKEKEEWTSAKDREGLVEKMKEKLSVVMGASFEFTQPIQLRFNELITGAKTDIAVKIFGEDAAILKVIADQAAISINKVRGAADVRVEQTDGLPQIVVTYDRKKLARFGLNVVELNKLVQMAFAGEKAGVVFENDRKFDLVTRFSPVDRKQLNLSDLAVRVSNGDLVPLSMLATSEVVEGPMQISREGARRKINIGVNVRDRDISGVVEEIQQTLSREVNLPPGYVIIYGGQFENLRAAERRLAVAVPVALGLIFAMLFIAFRSLKYALLIFTAVPLAAIGGVLALWLRGMPFSISAGVGFIALFGVAVLNGIVMISYFNRLRIEENLSIVKAVIVGSLTRMRPVLMTALVAALGFLPMAISTTNGAEVQKPLATVVIGGLITATVLTLVVLPVLYYLINQKVDRNET